MNRLFMLWCLAILPLFTCAQNSSELYQWPIKNAKAGSNVISSPQSYFEDELNFDDLFIEAREGDTVVSPVNGTITFIRVKYFSTLYNITSYKSDKPCFDEKITEIKPYLRKNMNPRYLCGSIIINTGEGTSIDIHGLSGDLVFKTGQRIRKGDLLGKVAYSYHKIKSPSIMISVSHKQKSADPMTPFGLKTSFIPPKLTPPVTSITNQEAQTDFLVYMESLKELFPGLYNVITPEELETYIKETVAKIASHKGRWQIDEFRLLMTEAVAKIHDSHIYFERTQTAKPCVTNHPQLILGWLNDTLICMNATPAYQTYIGRKVVSVNGMSADSMKKVIISRIGGFDQKASEYRNYLLATQGIRSLLESPVGNDTFDMDIQFAEGDTIQTKGFSSQGNQWSYVHPNKFFQINKHRDNYYVEHIDVSTAYMGFTNLAFNETTLENIAFFIRRMSKVPNLIIDLRNNGGGLVESINSIYSYIAQENVVYADYQKVNNKNDIKSLKYAINYCGITDLYSNYVPIEGKEGFYLPDATKRELKPDTVTNYKGKVYVLVNECSASAATLLPALLMREKRGVVIGRETRTAYNYMTAIDFADIRLPNSEIRIKIPLIECGFDVTPNTKIPTGRGVIPDYIVPLTLNELNYTEGDAILNFTYNLIKEEEQKKAKESQSRTSTMMWLILGGLLLGGGVIQYVKRRS